MDIRSFLPKDPYLEACAETSAVLDEIDKLAATRGLDPDTVDILSQRLHEELSRKSKRELLIHPTTWPGRILKLQQAASSCGESTDVVENAPYLAGAINDSIRKMPRQPGREWAGQLKTLYDGAVFVLGPEEDCCQCLASVIASAAPVNDNCHLQSV